MKKISLSVPKPCHENWDAMTPENKGKFCGSCQKTVLDFSTMNDRQLAEFFKKPAASVCGRFHPDQLERNIDIPRKRIPWVKYFVQFTWPAFVLFLKSCGQKDTTMGEIAIENGIKFPVSEHPLLPMMGAPLAKITAVDTLKKMKTTPDMDSQMIVGEVAPSPKMPMGDTLIVQLPEIKIDTAPAPKNNIYTMGMIIMPGQKCKVPKTKTDTVGKWKANRRAKIDEIKKDADAHSSNPVGYKPVAQNQLIHNTAAASLQGLAGVVGRVAVAPVTIKAEKVIQKEKVADQVKPSSGFLIYPNPASPNTALTLEFQNAESGAYNFSVINSAGEVVQKREVYVDKKRTTVSLNHIASGSYYISLNNKKTGKAYTQTVMVQ